MRPAIFLDRDGTLIEHVHHLRSPGDVRLIKGAGDAIRSLQSRGFACVVVTNQSVVGRGMLTLAGLNEIHDVMHRQLDEQRARLDGLYFCTVDPTGDDQGAIEHSHREPSPGMLLQAATELGLDLAGSWMVGDALTDMLAGRRAGCRAGILIRNGHGIEAEVHHDAVDAVVDNLPLAAALILERQNQPAYMRRIAGL